MNPWTSKRKKKSDGSGVENKPQNVEKNQRYLLFQLPSKQEEKTHKC